MQVGGREQVPIPADAGLSMQGSNHLGPGSPRLFALTYRSREDYPPSTNWEDGGLFSPPHLWGQAKHQPTMGGGGIPCAPMWQGRLGLRGPQAGERKLPEVTHPAWVPPPTPSCQDGGTSPHHPIPPVGE